MSLVPRPAVFAFSLIVFLLSGCGSSSTSAVPVVDSEQLVFSAQNERTSGEDAEEAALAYVQSSEEYAPGNGRNLRVEAITEGLCDGCWQAVATFETGESERQHDKWTAYLSVRNGAVEEGTFDFFASDRRIPDDILREMAVDAGIGTVRIQKENILWKRGDDDLILEGVGFAHAGDLRSDAIMQFHESVAQWFLDQGFVPNEENPPDEQTSWRINFMRREQAACNLMLTHRDVTSVAVRCAVLPNAPVHAKSQEEFTVILHGTHQLEWQPKYDEHMLALLRSDFPPSGEADNNEYAFTFLAIMEGKTEIIFSPVTGEAPDQIFLIEITEPSEPPSS